ncbi:MAG: oligosaccharide flippase family protein [bacterium]
MSDQLKKKIKKYGLSLGTNWFGIALTVITQVAFARLLGVSDYGRLSLCLAIVLLPLAIVDLGISPSTPRFMAMNIGKGRYDIVLAIAKKTVWATGIVALFYLSLMMLIKPWIVIWMKIPMAESTLWCLIIFSPAVYLTRWASSVLKGLGRIRTEIFLDSTLQRGFVLIMGGGAWYIFKTTASVAIGYGLSYLTTGFIGLFLCIIELRKLDVKRVEPFNFKLKDLLLHGIPINIAGLAQRILRRCDIIVVGALLDESAVGLYRVATTITSGIQKLITPLNTFALFHISKNVGEGAMNNIINYYSKVVNLSICLSLPVYYLIFRHAEKFLVVIYSSEYSAAALVLKVLCVGFAFFVAMGPMGAVFNALGKNWIRMWIVIVTGIVNILLNILLIRAIGLVGAAVSTSICFIILYVLFNISFRSMDIHFNKGASSFLTVLAGMLIASFLDFSFLKTNTCFYVLLSVFSFIVVCTLPAIKTYNSLKNR